MAGAVMAFVFPRIPAAGKGARSKGQTGGRKTFRRVCFCRAKAAEISLASLRFGIRGSWGASNLVLPAKESELLFPLIQLGLLELRESCVKSVRGISGRKSLLLRSAGNPTPCSRVSLRNLVAERPTRILFFASRGFHPVRVPFC